MSELLIEYPYLLAPLIFLARVADVSLGTFRTIVVFRGQKILASFIGFFEIMIWLLAASQVLTNLDQWYLALAYASGFAVGNYVGILIESSFAIGDELIRCISFNRDVLADELRKRNFKVVAFDGDMGETHPVELLLIIEKRRNVPALIELIKELDKSAVYSISDLKSVYEGPDLLPRRSFLGSLFMLSGKRR
ncbi:DUF2179 domain-containing protein [Sulfurimonas aquatica]|uniref:UPF0316 protein GJV85_07275 n=1 Tax=Sulfurimonas aquatica TaxID=2672570 RepID=A0A975B0L1_9BACT|nr:DUF2179 domain-containing protein [Sulfurimonas aquatica]QSZ41913.1 DUF2179 domain-containing protein [Sulfurimonas aquatica]